ncbi:MAG TPA: topoisomerase C-terminal repeat-containing protein, partial [Lacipirellulaceae bacterium]|nr:topoisomerase C-terminal repeat-containing protein [Lacipirellulaceae bacterium]
PDAMRAQLGVDEFRLFDMIWKRTIASQMADARGRRIAITIEGEGCTFQITGKTIDFPGYLRAYVEGSDDPTADLADQERILPSVAIGETLKCLDLDPKQHATQPPGRFSEASLTKALEERGIGRPSTYASIIDTIQARNYVFKKGGALVPTWVAFSVVQLLEDHLGALVDYQFTAQMEDDLDAISRGEQEHVAYLERFYFGNGAPGLKKQLAHKIDEIDPARIGRILIGKPDGEPEVYVRVGRYSPFVEQGERKASIPEDTPPDELPLEAALRLLQQAAQGEEPLGVCPDTDKPVYLKTGRFGPYVQRGVPDDEEKPQNASLLRGMTPADVDLATALKLLSLPRDLGDHPAEQKPVTAYNGRFGPYVKCGDETRSLPADVSPLEVTLEQAIHLLAQPKTRGRGAAAKKEPLRVFDKPSPVTEQPVQILDGRYGPYITDGTTNLSLRKGMTPEELTFDEALALLADKAAQGPPAKKASRKKAAPKKAAAKKAAPKKAARKKSATKKSG